MRAASGQDFAAFCFVVFFLRFLFTDLSQRLLERRLGARLAIFLFEQLRERHALCACSVR